MKRNKENTMPNTESNFDSSKTGKSLYHVNPLGMRILVRIPDQDSVTDGGLYLPETAKDSMTESVIVEVVEVASAHDIDLDEDTNISGIPRGSRVLISKRVGTKVPWDDKLRIVDTKDVLAIVEKIDLS